MNKEEIKKMLRIDLSRTNKLGKVKDSSPDEEKYFDSYDDIYKMIGIVR